MDYKVVSESSPEGLTSKVKKMIEDGWEPIGGHTVNELRRYNRYSGTQHRDTIVECEFSQTMIKKD